MDKKQKISLVVFCVLVVLVYIALTLAIGISPIEILPYLFTDKVINNEFPQVLLASAIAFLGAALFGFISRNRSGNKKLFYVSLALLTLFVFNIACLIFSAVAIGLAD